MKTAILTDFNQWVSALLIYGYKKTLSSNYCILVMKRAQCGILYFL